MQENDNNQNQGGGDQNNQENNNKVVKAFEKNMERLAKIVGGEENIAAPKKVGDDILAKVTNGLLKDRRASLEKEVQADLITILDKKVALDKEIKAKKEEFEKLQLQKKKEFNEACGKVFAKIEGIDKLGEDYLATLKSVGQAEPKEDKKD